MRTKRTAKLVAVGLFLTASLWAQDPSQRPAAPAGRAAEVPVDGLVWKDVYSVALTVPGKQAGPGVDAGPELVVKNFEFNGDAVTTDKLHFKQLAPGVVEIASVAYSVGNWPGLIVLMRYWYIVRLLCFLWRIIGRVGRPTKTAFAHFAKTTLILLHVDKDVYHKS